MSEPFDPYSQWLGIEPHEMPVDHYRLLGLTRFEDDPETIAEQADERMAYVRSLQTGPRGGYTQSLLNELAAARVCLLNPHAKRSYDQMLEGMFRASQPPPAPAEIDSSPEIEVTSDEPKVASNHWVAGVLIGVIIAGLGPVVILSLQWYQSQTTLEFEQDSLDVRDLGELVVDASPNEGGMSPVLVYQEADGGVNFDAGFAQLHGPSIRRSQMTDVDVVTQWRSMDDWVSWKFKLVKLPPQGMFLVRVTYAAHHAADGGSFVIAVDGNEKECEVRGTGEAVTDEHFLAITNTGEHTLTVRAKSKPADELMTLKAVTFVFAGGDRRE